MVASCPLAERKHGDATGFTRADPAVPPGGLRDRGRGLLGRSVTVPRGETEPPWIAEPDGVCPAIIARAIRPDRLPAPPREADPGHPRLLPG
jgi:hypothetical protein